MKQPLISNFTDPEVATMLSESYSLWEFAQKLGYTNKSSGVYKAIKFRLRERGFDLSNYPQLSRRVGITAPLTEEEVFSQNRRVDCRLLRSNLITAGRLYECEECGISEWRGQKLTLQVDHINGVNNDNRLENLRFLCPNCHCQTSTWGIKNR